MTGASCLISMVLMDVWPGADCLISMVIMDATHKGQFPSPPGTQKIPLQLGSAV